jgi:hypothetical protein
MKEGKGRVGVKRLGVMKYLNGDTYKGDWVRDEKKGKGLFKVLFT